MNKSFCLIITSFILCLAAGAQAKDADPNNYFQDKTKTIKINKLGLLKVKSEYRAEPVQRPNKMNITLHCSKEKSKKVLEDFNYCGLDSVSVLGDRVLLMLTEYDASHPQGYCAKKTRKFVRLPASCD